MHIILYVFEIIEVKSGFKIFLRPPRLFRGHMASEATRLAFGSNMHMVL